MLGSTRDLNKNGESLPSFFDFIQDGHESCVCNLMIDVVKSLLSVESR